MTPADIHYWLYECPEAKAQADSYDLDEAPRYWCTDCHAFRFTRRDVDGYPICRVCSPTTGE
jgi:streptogramin lyase